MKAKIILTLSALLISVLCFSQDIISYKNGVEVKAKVLEITTSEVKFKKFDNPEGPTYTVLKSDLFMITYENGSKEIFSAQPNTPVSSPSQAPNPTSYSNIEPEVEPDEDLGYDRIHYNGPRVGFTILNEGTSKDMLLERGNQPFIVQFGWQFETRLFSIENGPTGLVEWAVLVGGVEKGLFLPSISMLLGIRNNNNGLEFGLGPNLSLSGVGMAFAVGGSLKSDKMYFPINLVFVPSVSNKDYYTQITERTGSRISLLIGFNTRVN